jgi:hypothetical protein
VGGDHAHRAEVVFTALDHVMTAQEVNQL